MDLFSPSSDGPGGKEGILSNKTRNAKKYTTALANLHFSIWGVKD